MQNPQQNPTQYLFAVSPGSDMKFVAKSQAKQSCAVLLQLFGTKTLE